MSTRPLVLGARQEDFVLVLKCLPTACMKVLWRIVAPEILAKYSVQAPSTWQVSPPARPSANRRSLHFRFAIMEQPSVIDPPPAEEERWTTLFMAIVRWVAWKRREPFARLFLPAMEQSVSNPPEGWKGHNVRPHYNALCEFLHAEQANRSDLFRGYGPRPAFDFFRSIFVKVHSMFYERRQSNFLPSAIFCSVGLVCLEAFGHEVNVGLRWAWVTELRRRLERFRAADNPLDWLPTDKGLLFLSCTCAYYNTEAMLQLAQPAPGELGIAEEFAARVCRHHPEFYANFLRPLFVEEDLARNADLPAVVSPSK